MQKVEFDRMQDLRSAVLAVVPAASTDDERPDMHGVGLEVFGGELHARATDGRWCMRVRTSPSHATDGFRVLIPMAYVKRLVALIGDGLGQARIVKEADLIRFEIEKIGRLDLPQGVAEVSFPKVEEVWPSNHATSMDAIGLNPRLMSNLAKAFGVVHERPTLRFAFHGENAPVVVTCIETERADAILMPSALRDDDDEDEEDRQAVLFPEAELEAQKAKEQATLDKAIEGIKNPGGDLHMVSHGFEKAPKKKGKPKSKPKAAGKKSKPKKRK
jgi:hypothetical protein